MLTLASTVAIPTWLAPVLVGITTLGAVVNAIGGIIGDLIALRRLQALDAERTRRETAQHAELLNAIQLRKDDADK